MFEPTSTCANVTFGQFFIELKQIRSIYDFYGLDEWFWAMFELTPTWATLYVNLGQ